MKNYLLYGFLTLPVAVLLFQKLQALMIFFWCIIDSFFFNMMVYLFQFLGGHFEYMMRYEMSLFSSGSFSTSWDVGQCARKIPNVHLCLVFKKGLLSDIISHQSLQCV